MRFLALASDYDGTLAHDGVVKKSSVEAIQRLKTSGRRFILVTGRQLAELKEAFPEYEVCDLIVAENGATLFDPKTHVETLLAEPPPARFAEELRARGALPLAVGKVIVATWQPHEMVVFETIRDLGLELQVIFNKGAVMILPSGVNKASGLLAALKTLGLSLHNVVAVGDAENDHALLRACEACAVPRNALDSLKDEADLVTAGDHGRGVEELIEMIVRNDLASLDERMRRHDLELGRQANDTIVHLPSYGTSVLIAGTSGGGKSTLAMSFIEKLTKCQRQFCIIDPEGDYAEMPHAVVLGNSGRAPAAEEVMTALQRPEQNCVVNLIGIALSERPAYFEKLFTELLQLRVRTGRPHWLILDETHHIVPAEREKTEGVTPRHVPGVLLITVEPAHIAQHLLLTIDLVLAIGREPARTLATFCEAVGEAPPAVPDQPLEPGEVMGWWRRPRGEPFRFTSDKPSLPRLRHVRKYAEGDVREGSFIFRGPDEKLRLRAQNLFVFLQMGDGVDDRTWDFHLRRGDFEKWFAEIIKDPELAAFAAEVAGDENHSTAETRKALRTKIEERYTFPT